MTQSLILIQGKNVKKENLNISLSNALQIVIGNGPGFGFILHISATTPDDLGDALIRFAKIPKVTGVVTLMIRTT